MKSFYVLAVWLLVFSCTFILGPDVVLAQTANKTSIQGFVVTFSRFLTNIILPFLFSVAFLYFIYNIAKYFIIGGASDTERKKGKQQAIYGIAAFVFLFSFWAIVSIFTVGFGFTRTSTLCLDYFDLMNGPCSERSGTSFSGGGLTGTDGAGIGNSNQGTGSGAGAGGTGTYGSGAGGNSTGAGGGLGTGADGTGTGAPLSELIFGTGKDSAGFHRSFTVSGALNSTPVIGTTTSCINGFNTLKLSSSIETTQAAYLYYTTATGQKQWKNVTDRMSTNYIGYDRDAIDDIVESGAKALYLVHTHPSSRTNALSLSMGSQGPSAADFTSMCSMNNEHVTFVTVDKTGVWTARLAAATCPLTPAAAVALPTLETYSALAALEPSTRARELTDYLASPLTPTIYKTHFTSINKDLLGTQSMSEILTQSTAQQTVAGIRVAYSNDALGLCGYCDAVPATTGPEQLEWQSRCQN